MTKKDKVIAFANELKADEEDEIYEAYLRAYSKPQTEAIPEEAPYAEAHFIAYLLGQGDRGIDTFRSKRKLLREVAKKRRR